MHSKGLWGLAAIALGMTQCAGGAPPTRTATNETRVTMKMQTDMKGQGAPLVLVGGGLTGWLSWEPHQTRLAPTRKVVRAQLLSVQYGLEGRPLPEDYSVDMESRALSAAIDELGFAGPVDLVAWSYG